MKRWDPKGVVQYLPLQDPSALALTRRPREALEQAVHLVRPDNAVFSGAAALRELLGYLPLGWIGRPLFVVPGALPIAERLYRWVARTWGPVRS